MSATFGFFAFVVLEALINNEVFWALTIYQNRRSQLRLQRGRLLISSRPLFCFERVLERLCAQARANIWSSVLYVTYYLKHLWRCARLRLESARELPIWVCCLACRSLGDRSLYKPLRQTATSQSIFVLSVCCHVVYRPPIELTCTDFELWILAL